MPKPPPFGVSASPETPQASPRFNKLMVGQDSSQGRTYSGGTWRNRLPEVTLTYETDKYAESDALNLHSADTEAHLSTDERAALSELLANTLAIVTMATPELNPFLEYIQNGASVGAIMGIFLWREMKRAERYEKILRPRANQSPSRRS